MNLLKELGKSDKCEACRAFYRSFVLRSLINSILQKHECYSLFIFYVSYGIKITLICICISSFINMKNCCSTFEPASRPYRVSLSHPPILYFTIYSCIQVSNTDNKTVPIQVA